MALISSSAQVLTSTVDYALPHLPLEQMWQLLERQMRIEQLILKLRKPMKLLNKQLKNRQLPIMKLMQQFNIQMKSLLWKKMMIKLLMNSAVMQSIFKKILSDDNSVSFRLIIKDTADIEVFKSKVAKLSIYRCGYFESTFRDFRVWVTSRPAEILPEDKRW